MLLSFNKTPHLKKLLFCYLFIDQGSPTSFYTFRAKCGFKVVVKVFLLKHGCQETRDLLKSSYSALRFVEQFCGRIRSIFPVFVRPLLDSEVKWEAVTVVYCVF